MKHKEPRVRMIKRPSISVKENIIIHLIAVLLALIVCALVIVMLTSQSPLKIYQGIYKGAVGNPFRTWITIRETMVLLLVSVGLTPAFKMRFWNIGAEGQILVGGMASAALMIYAGNKVPAPLLLILILICSMAAGLVWGLIPAFFKARFNTNETLFTLMMNYVAMQLVTFSVCIWEKPAGSNSVPTINQDTQAGWFPALDGNSSHYIVNVIIVMIVTFAIYEYLKKSKQGFEISVVGSSQNTARYAGINVKKVILRTMMISGAICGLAGALIVSGSDHTISTNTANGRGFTAIIVAWMAKFNPFVMILISALLVFMQQGAVQVASQFHLNKYASDIITGIILFFLIGSEFFVNYKLEFRKKEAA